MADPFGNEHRGLGDPARAAVAVTPDNDDPLENIPQALYVGTGGDITMQGAGDDADQVWKNVADGAILPFRAQYIRATGTTAADILALY